MQSSLHLLQARRPEHSRHSQHHDLPRELRHNPELKCNKVSTSTRDQSPQRFEEILSCGEIDFENHFDYPNSPFSSQESTVTDRFIPSRKHLEYPSPIP